MYCKKNRQIERNINRHKVRKAITITCMHLVEKESFIELKEKINTYKETVRKPYRLTDRKAYKQTERKKGYNNNVYEISE